MVEKKNKKSINFKHLFWIVPVVIFIIYVLIAINNADVKETIKEENAYRIYEIQQENDVITNQLQIDISELDLSIDEGCYKYSEIMIEYITKQHKNIDNALDIQQETAYYLESDLLACTSTIEATRKNSHDFLDWQIDMMEQLMLYCGSDEEIINFWNNYTSQNEERTNLYMILWSDVEEYCPESS